MTSGTGKAWETAKPGSESPVDLPVSDVLQWWLADGTMVTVRPSGTEPKIKFYILARTDVKGGALDAARAESASEGQGHRRGDPGCRGFRVNRYGFLRRIRTRSEKTVPVPRPGRLSLPELRELWGRASFVALDFETTGLDWRTDRICEIGAVRLSETGGELESLDILVNPGRPIHPEASRVSGITDEMVREARPVEEALPELLAFLGDSVIAAHNASFDLGFLRAALERAGLGGSPDRVPNRVADTRDLAREAFPGLPSYALQSLVRAFGLASGNAHRACDDARACARLLAICAESGAEGSPEQAGTSAAEAG